MTEETGTQQQMPHGVTLVCSGYTAYGRLKLGDGGIWTDLLMTSFECTFQRSMMVSQGMMSHAANVCNVYRYKGAYVEDFPEMSLSIEYEPCYLDMERLFYFLVFTRNAKCELEINDLGNGINWYFGRCYLIGATVTVEENSNTSVSLSFTVDPLRFAHEWGMREAIPSDTSRLTPGYELLPYWVWGITGLKKDLTGFTLSYTQPANPVYECCGTQYPNSFSALMFGLPEVTLNTNYAFVEADGFYQDNKGWQYMSRSAELPEITFTIGENPMLTASGVVCTSASPTFVSNISLHESFTVHGCLKIPYMPNEIPSEE